MRRVSSRMSRAAIVVAALGALIVPLRSVCHGKEVAPPATPVATTSKTIGKIAPDFALPDAAGKPVTLHDFHDKTIVLYFLGVDCPIANLYLPDLADLQMRYAERGMQVIGVQSNAGVTPGRVTEHQKEFKIAFPVLMDAGQKVADALGATRTAEVFLLDRQHVVRYHGSIDDRYGYTFKKNEPKRHNLEEALKEILAGKPVTVAETTPRGCLITHADHAPAKARTTYAKEVSRILQSRCEECHRSGEVAPFALQTYDDAVEHSAMIKEVVLQRRMPPWHADPHFGDFSNNRRMTQDEMDQLIGWIDGGMPMGDTRELPPPHVYPDGWKIGKPDLVFELPKEVAVPATGTVPYLYYSVPTNFKEDVWIQAAEARPGNPAVVHHIIVFYKEPNSFDPAAGLERHHICGTAPGDPPNILPAGVGRRIPKGSQLVFQMHYTPNGKAATDRSKVGFVLFKDAKSPKWTARTRPIMNPQLHLPPGDANHRVEASMKMPDDMLIYQLMPHMHLRGKDFLYQLTYPDGRIETLLSVPQYDFNWQNTYRFTTPVLAPKGSRLRCVAHFDNSKGNPANPDPTADVYWGDQTWEEMMIGWVTYVWKDPAKQGATEPGDPDRRNRRHRREKPKADVKTSSTK